MHLLLKWVWPSKNGCGQAVHIFFFFFFFCLTNVKCTATPMFLVFLRPGSSAFLFQLAIVVTPTSEPRLFGVDP